MSEVLNTEGLLEVSSYMYYDGPIMGLYKLDQVLYIGLWSDIVDQGLPTQKDLWLFAEVDTDTVAALEDNRLTTRVLLETAQNLYRGENGCHWSYPYSQLSRPWPRGNVPPAVRITWADVEEGCRPAVDSFLSSP